MLRILFVCDVVERHTASSMLMAGQAGVAASATRRGLGSVSDLGWR
jgi:hypothetical protein